MEIFLAFRDLWWGTPAHTAVGTYIILERWIQSSNVVHGCFKIPEDLEIKMNLKKKQLNYE